MKRYLILIFLLRFVCLFFIFFSNHLMLLFKPLIQIWCYHLNWWVLGDYTSADMCVCVCVQAWPCSQIPVVGQSDSRNCRRFAIRFQHKTSALPILFPPPCNGKGKKNGTISIAKYSILFDSNWPMANREFLLNFEKKKNPSNLCLRAPCVCVH